MNSPAVQAMKGTAPFRSTMYTPGAMKMGRWRTPSTRARHSVGRWKYGVRLPGPKGIVGVFRWLMIFGGRFPAVFLVHTRRLLALAVLGRFHGGVRFHGRFHRLGGFVRRFLRNIRQRRWLLGPRHSPLDCRSMLGMIWQRGRFGGPI